MIPSIARMIREGTGSHIPTLLAAFASTTGPVLEVGAGHYSTPLLHSLCSAAQRKLVTLESDPMWWERFASLSSEIHDIRLLENWDGWESVMTEEPWGLVFIDHAPSEHRPLVLAKVPGSAIAVVHDAQRKDGGQRPAIDSFRYRVFDKPRSRSPWTVALSHQQIPFSERDVRHP